ncbi:2-keto-4-pentenoate hydratase [Alicyclobacillus fastidiosus]|uniref:Fumarylacetoacetate hydrolase family protein n=1 Tax=Alicyclobacillus fastidiosus TaxID=392011 RepID=A0ABV5ABX9_9BACL|nr:fumarylacetoacetate hydrolase family protein [Alicyclobacillus fastidiosus]WEH11514.1 fumarylacetoacetate hydrolase family protein [Alicyclobacillus fastidiosus]
MALQLIAEEIYRHQTAAEELEKITLRNDGLTVEDAYEIQQLSIQKYIANGDRLIGWKMGLTSKAKQLSVGVDEAIYGHLLKSMELENPEVSLNGLIHPRVEPEIAFVFNKRLEGEDISPRDVWLATECVIPAFEIIDSRYKNFSFTLVDVIADNASSAQFYLADQAYSPYQFQLDQVGVVMKRNGEVSQTGAGAAVLGHPVRSIVEQVRMLSKIGKAIEPGMVVLTGGITEAIYIHDGDRISIEFEGMGEIELTVRA